jgi:hypothetical protein
MKPFEGGHITPLSESPKIFLEITMRKIWKIPFASAILLAGTTLASAAGIGGNPGEASDIMNSGAGQPGWSFAHGQTPLLDKMKTGSISKCQIHENGHCSSGDLRSHQ